MTKEQEEAIEYVQKQIDYYKEQIKFIEAVDSDYYDEEYELYKNRVKQFETVLNMPKENSAEIEQKNTELAEKSAEIEKYKSLYNKALEDLVKADRENIENKKVIDLMVKAMNKIKDPQVCKYCDNNINLNHRYCTDAKKCKEGIKQYFERKCEE